MANASERQACLIRNLTEMVQAYLMSFYLTLCARCARTMCHIAIAYSIRQHISSARLLKPLAIEPLASAIVIGSPDAGHVASMLFSHGSKEDVDGILQEVSAGFHHFGRWTLLSREQTCNSHWNCFYMKVNSISCLKFTILYQNDHSKRISAHG
jgi:hypothetical protein